MAKREQQEVVLVLFEERAPVAVRRLRVQAVDCRALVDAVRADTEEEGVRLDDAAHHAWHALELVVCLERVIDDDLVTDTEPVRDCSAPSVSV